MQRESTGGRITEMPQGDKSTTHTMTGASPAQLLFMREICTKVLQVKLLSDEMTLWIDLRACDNDDEKKRKTTDYVDLKKRHAMASDLQLGDKVLLQNTLKDKLSTQFETSPYEVVDKKGSQVTINK